MKNLILLLFVTFLVTSCQNETKISGYELNGFVKNMPDSTYVTLQHDNKVLDSTYVINEKFQFTGKVDAPINVYVLMSSIPDYKSFWLENSKMDLVGEKGKVREAKITGSQTQKEDDKYFNLTKLFREKQDSLNILYADTTKGKAHQKEIITASDKLRNEEALVTHQFIEDHPNSLVSTDLLKIYKTTYGKKKTTELYGFLSEARKSSDDGQAIKNFIELSNNPKIGEKYVDFEQENAKGESIKFSSLAKGKYTLIEFWASWCAPCRKSNPKLVESYNKYKDQGFEILGVSLDVDKKSWIKAIEKDGLTWENVSDLKGDENEAGLIYEVSGIPDNVLVNSEGIIVARMLRGDDLTEKLDQLFEKDKNL